MYKNNKSSNPQCYSFKQCNETYSNTSLKLERVLLNGNYLCSLIIILYNKIIVKALIQNMRVKTTYLFLVPFI